MSEDQRQNHVGEQIKDALADALQSGDFKDLNDLVTQTVTDTLNEVGRQFMDGVSAQDIPPWKMRAKEWEQKRQDRNRQEEAYRQQEERRRKEQFSRQEERRRQEQFSRQEELRRKEQFTRQEEERRRREQAAWREEQRRLEEERRQRREALRQAQAKQKFPSMQVPAVRKRNVGKVPGILYQVFGGIGVGITGLFLLGQLILFLIGMTGSPVKLLVNLLFLGGFAGMIGLGVGKLKRLKRADRYVELCGPKMYGDIERLAEGTGKSNGYVRRDLRRMLRAGMFPEGHLDGQKTCFMLNDAVYGQYLELEKSRQCREEEKSAASEKEPSLEEPQEGQTEDSRENELNAMVSEGMECIRRLRELNDNIEGEVISRKLFRLEELLKEIFDSVREHPEQMHRMHKLMEYYLPTTLKLVEAYEDFDKISVPGEEVLQAKVEIEKTLDTINQAFAELLNNLFQDAVFDATTDAQVLASMLAKEGLTKEMELVNHKDCQGREDIK